jgi:hypothetical protein
MQTFPKFSPVVTNHGLFAYLLDGELSCNGETGDCTVTEKSSFPNDPPGCARRYGNPIPAIYLSPTNFHNRPEGFTYIGWLEGSGRLAIIAVDASVIVPAGHLEDATRTELDEEGDEVVVEEGYEPVLNIETSKEYNIIIEGKLVGVIVLEVLNEERAVKVLLAPSDLHGARLMTIPRDLLFTPPVETPELEMFAEGYVTDELDDTDEEVLPKIRSGSLNEVVSDFNKSGK